MLDSWHFPFSDSFYKGKNPKGGCPLPGFHVLHAYVLTCLQDSWPGIVIKGFEPATFGPVAQVRFLACLVQRQVLQGGKPK